MRMKLLVLLVPAVTIMAGACAMSASAETLNSVGSGLSGVITTYAEDVLSSTWAMLLVGFLGLGYAARPRRKKSRPEGLTASHVPEA